MFSILYFFLMASLGNITKLPHHRRVSSVHVHRGMLLTMPGQPGLCGTRVLQRRRIRQMLPVRRPAEPHVRHDRTVFYIRGEASKCF